MEPAGAVAEFSPGETEEMDAAPALTSTPSYIETGVVIGTPVSETLTLKNQGQMPVQNVRLELVGENNSQALVWAIVNVSEAPGAINVGGSLEVGVYLCAGLKRSQDQKQQFWIARNSAVHPWMLDPNSEKMVFDSMCVFIDY